MSTKQQLFYGSALIAMALQISAICTDHWSVGSLPDSDMINAMVKKLPTGVKTELVMGLWKGCVQMSEQTKDTGKVQGDICLHLPPDGDHEFPKHSIQAARAFSLMGVILIFLGVLCMTYMKGYKRCPSLMLALGGICSIVANVIWFIEFRKFKLGGADLNLSVGYSFYLNMSAGVIALLASGYTYFQ